jgi:hypothetical protein
MPYDELVGGEFLDGVQWSSTYLTLLGITTLNINLPEGSKNTSKVNLNL